VITERAPDVRGLKAFGNWCAAEEVAAAGGFRGLRRPKVPRRLIAPFSDPELRSLLALADEIGGDPVAT
jgi:hypothetical protein